VKRVAVSKVRMPRSHRMTLGLPPDSTYSADSSHSWMVVDMPRLRSTGLPASATRRSSEKFCTLRAPICKISEYSATTSTLSGPILSDHRQTGLAPGFVQQLQPLGSSPNAWQVAAENAAAQHAGAGRLHARGDVRPGALTEHGQP
jgi:hypothetical protein